MLNFTNEFILWVIFFIFYVLLLTYMELFIQRRKKCAASKYGIWFLLSCFCAEWWCWWYSRYTTKKSNYISSRRLNWWHCTNTKKTHFSTISISSTLRIDSSTFFFRCFSFSSFRCLYSFVFHLFFACVFHIANGRWLINCHNFVYIFVFMYFNR